MKRKGLITLICIAVLLVISVYAVGVGTVSAANDGESITTAKIGTANVAYNGKLRLAFTVEKTLLTPDDATLGIMVWDSDVTEPTAKNCKYVNLNAKTQNGTTYYLVRPTVLEEIGKEFYVAACYKQNGVITLAQKPFEYSIEKYFTTCIASPVSEPLADICTEYLELAKELGASDLTGIKANGGYVGYNKFSFGGAMGQQVLLRADAKNGDGKYFLCWKDSEGKVISDSRITSVKVESEGVTEYFALYGDRELSKYKASYDFESLDSGLMDFAYPTEDDISKIISGYDSKKTPLFKGTKSLEGLSITTYRSLKSIGKDQYVYSTGHDFYLVDSPIGGKSMMITNGHQARGFSASFSDIYESYAIGGEVDIQYNTAVSGGFFHVNLNIVDKNGKSASLRTNITTDGKTATFYAEGSGSEYPSVYLDRKINLKEGNVLSFRAELDRESEAVAIYANGELLQKISLNSYATYKKLTDAAAKKSEETGETVKAFDLETITVSSILVAGISSTKDDITIDNVSFICGDPIVKDNTAEGGAK